MGDQPNAESNDSQAARPGLVLLDSELRVVWASRIALSMMHGALSIGCRLNELELEPRVDLDNWSRALRGGTSPEPLEVLFEGVSWELAVVEGEAEHGHFLVELKRAVSLGPDDEMRLLAKGMAHEFNNVLHLILGGVQCLETSPPALAKEWLVSVRSAINRGRRLMNRVRPFLQDSTEEPQVIALKLLLEGVADTVRHGLGSTRVNPSDVPDVDVPVDAAKLLRLFLVLMRDLYNRQSGTLRTMTLTASLEGTELRIDILAADSSAGFEPIASDDAQSKDVRAFCDSLGLALEATADRTGYRLLFGPLQGAKACDPKEALGVLIHLEPSAPALVKALEALEFTVLATDGVHAKGLIEDYDEEIDYFVLELPDDLEQALVLADSLRKLMADRPIIAISSMDGVLEAISQVVEPVYAVLKSRIDKLGETIGRALMR